MFCVHVGVNGLACGHVYLIADVNLRSGFTSAVFLGREPEGGMYRFALSGSEEVIALAVDGVVERIFNTADCEVVSCDP